MASPFSSSSLPLVRPIEKCRVSPPQGSVPATSLPLTFFDVIWLHLHPVERLFFYPFPHPTSHFLSLALPSLKSSLSLALRSFFPLASVLRRSPDRFELFFSDATSPGVPFTVAECADDGGENGSLFDYLAKGHPREVSLLRQLVPSLASDCADSPPPVLAVQVTVFPSRGVVVGIASHHAVCDGGSILRFLRCWSASAAAAAAAVPSPGPAGSVVVVVDRTLIPDPHDNYSIFYKLVSEINNSAAAAAAAAVPADTVFASFTLRKRHVQALKDSVSARAASGFHCSTLVVTFAFVFVGYVRVKGAAAAGRAAHMGFPADFRSRMRPPIPAEYFGNCVGPCLADADGGDLADDDDGFFVAAEAIGRAIGGLGKSLENARDWLHEFRSRGAGLLLTVAGSPKFGVYGIDFGWGRPAKVEIVSVANTGAVAVAESGEEEGGVEVGLGLPRNEMDLFQNYFFDGLKRLDDHHHA